MAKESMPFELKRPSADTPVTNATEIDYGGIPVACGLIYDISVAHAVSNVPAQYESLSAALGTNGANVPQDVRKRGMSIKFFNSTTNKYEIWNLISSSWSADVANWKNPTEADSINYNGNSLPDTLNLIGKLSVNESNVVLSFLGKSFTIIENRDVQPPSSQTSAICGQAMCGKTICGLII